MATPLAYGLKLPNVYAREEVARLAAERCSNRWGTYVAVPLFGPDVLEGKCDGGA